MARERTVWVKRMQEEVALLPETLATLRESADHIRKVSEDLTEVTATLKRISAAMDRSGLIDASEMMSRSGEALRMAAENMAQTNRVFGDLNDAMSKTIGRIPGADVLNPFRKK